MNMNSGGRAVFYWVDIRTGEEPPVTAGMRGEVKNTRENDNPKPRSPLERPRGWSLAGS